MLRNKIFKRLASIAVLAIIIQGINSQQGNNEGLKITKEQLQKSREQLKQSKEQLRAVKLPPCASCRALVESFNQVNTRFPFSSLQFTFFAIF